MQSCRHIASLKGITGDRSIQIRLKIFCMLANVTRSFRLERPNLESCGDEAMLRLFIAVCKSIQPFERDRQEMCVIQKTR